VDDTAALIVTSEQLAQTCVLSSHCRVLENTAHWNALNETAWEGRGGRAGLRTHVPSPSQHVLAGGEASRQLHPIHDLQGGEISDAIAGAAAHGRQIARARVFKMGITACRRFLALWLKGAYPRPLRLNIS
jgi:hypothetical protein